MPKKTGNIERDFDCIALIAIADSAFQDATNHLKDDKAQELWTHRDSLIKRLMTQANECYAAQCSDKSKIRGTFARIKSATEMRDTLYQFMRHWLASMLQKEHYSLYKALPSGYGWNC